METTARYSFLLGVQAFLLFADLLLNGFFELVRSSSELKFVILWFQDILIIVSMAVTFISFFATDKFQVGLVGDVLRKFKLHLLTVPVYFLLCIALHTSLFTESWQHFETIIWTPKLMTPYIIQRFVSPIYYFSTKRATLMISDEKFYKISDS